MILTGALVNFGTILVGGIIGTFLRKGFPEKLHTALTYGLGLCVLYVGVKGVLQGNNTMVVILSVVLGVLIGELIDFDRWLNRFASYFQSKMKKQKTGVAEGFISATLFVCVGAMAIVGALQSGLVGSHETLIAKALIDGVVAVVMASALGFGVCFSAVSVLVYEAVLTLSARAIAPYLDTVTVNEMTCVGSLLIIAIALNLMKITNIKVANFILATFFPILLCRFL
jgi:uncharacterized membrane protein YqgA involved in biofilm formation